MKFKKEIYVRIEEDGDNTYLVAGNTVDDTNSEHGDMVAIYRLVEVRKFVEKSELVKP